jgi:hypothetical protein
MPQETETTPAPTARTDRPGPSVPPRALPTWLLALGIVIGPAGATGLVQGLRSDPTAPLVQRLDQIDGRLKGIEDDGRETRRSVRELEVRHAAEDARARERAEEVRSHLAQSRDPAAQRALRVLGEPP